MGKVVLTDENSDRLNPFLVLGVNKYLIDRFSSDDELRKFVKGVYLSQIKQIHPDAHSGCLNKEMNLKMINKAWEKIEKTPNLSAFRNNQEDNQGFGSSFAKQLSAQDDKREIARLQKDISSLKESLLRQKDGLIGEGYEKLKHLEESVMTNHISLTKELKSRTSLNPHSLADKFFVEVAVTHAVKSSVAKSILTKMKAVVKVNRNLMATKTEKFLGDLKTKKQLDYSVPLSGNNDNGETFLIGSIDPKHLKATDYCLSKDEMGHLLPFLKTKIEKGRCLVCVFNRNTPAYYISGQVLGFIKIKKATAI